MKIDDMMKISSGRIIRKSQFRVTGKDNTALCSFSQVCCWRFAPGLKGYFEFDDLVSVGIHGLINAVEGLILIWGLSLRPCCITD